MQESLICLKNVVIGSDKQKGSVISQGVVPKLMSILSDDSMLLCIRYDAAIVLGKCFASFLFLYIEKRVVWCGRQMKRHRFYITHRFCIHIIWYVRVQYTRCIYVCSAHVVCDIIEVCMVH